METFTAASHDDVLRLILQLAVLLFSARALGEVSRKLGQPAVVGEILAGVLLGPSLLSGLVPQIGQWILPQSAVQGYLLETVSLIGVMLLMVVTGLETDLQLIRRHAKTALGVSLGGITVTFFTGFLLAWYLPAALIGPGTPRLIFALFVGTAMSISAIPVLAKVLMDLNLMRRDIGQTVIASGMTDDTVGWILLSIVVALASGEISVRAVLLIVITVVALLLLSLTLGRLVVRKVLDFVQNHVPGSEAMLTTVIVLAFGWAAVTQALHFEPVLGAFLCGIVLGQVRRLPHETVRNLESIASAIFTPIFFAVAGLKIDVRALTDPSLLGFAFLVVLVASGGKYVGTYLGARLIGGKDHWTALAFGSGLNARGAMEIIIATIGLSIGVLSRDMFTLILLMAVVIVFELFI